MANSTFNGPIRSENGFKQISINSTTGAVTEEAVYDTRPNFRQTVDNSTFNAGEDVDTTLTTAQSGTIFNVVGTHDNIVNLPALSTANVGTTYEFFLKTATASDKTVSFVLPGAAVSAFHGAIQLMGGTAANPASDIIGDILTLVNSTVANARVKLTCVTDDGTNSIWKTEVLSTPIATIA